MTAHPRRGLIGNSEANTSKGGMLTSYSNIANYNSFGQDWVNIPGVAGSDNISFDSNVSAYSFEMSHNGKYLFVYYYGDRIDRYVLGTSYDISTRQMGSYGGQNFSTSNYGENDGRVLRWSSDGHELYISGMDHDVVSQWHTDTPWDMGTGGNKLKLGDRKYYKATDVSKCIDIVLGDNGTKMFLLDGISDGIDQYTLSTAYDVSTASHDGFRDISDYVATPLGFGFSNDGSSVFILDSSGPEVVKYDLGSNWNVTDQSWSYNGTKTFTSVMSNPNGFTFSEDALKIYIYRDTSVQQFSINSSLDISSISNSPVVDDNLSTHLNGSSIYDITKIAFNSDGTQAYVFLNTTNSNLYVLTMSTEYDISTVSGTHNAIYYADSVSIPGSVNADHYDYKIHNTGGIYISDNYVYLTDSDSNLNTYQANVHRLKLLVSDDLYSLHTGIHFYNPDYNGKFSSSSDTLYDLRFSKDGKKFLLLNYSNHTIYHFTCLIPWMISSGNYTLGQNNLVSYDGYTTLHTDIESTHCICVADDGMTLFISSGDTDHPIAQCKLPGYFQPQNGSISIDWKISNFRTKFGNSDCSYLTDLLLSPDGQYFYVLSDGFLKNIKQYKLQTY